MPPPRTRLIIDDAKSEASNTRDRTGGVPNISANYKNKRNGNSALAGCTFKDVTSAAQAVEHLQEVQYDLPKVSSIPTAPDSLH